MAKATLMDRDAFFAKLTDEAATPDPKFINDLRQKVVDIAAGGAPPSSGPGTIMKNPFVIASIIGTTLFLGTIVGGIVSQNQGVEDSPAPIVSSGNDTSDPDNDVLAVVDDPNETQSDDLAVADSDEQNDPLQTSTPTDDPGDVVVEDSTPPSSGSVEVEDPDPDSAPPRDDPADGVELDESYTVSFWSVDPFKLAPKIPTDNPDYTEKVPELRYDWGDGGPEKVTKNHFVAQAVATKYLAEGTHQIEVLSDDGVRVYVNGKLVIDRWSIGSTQVSDSAVFTVKGDAPTKIVVEYFENRDKAYLFVNISKFDLRERSIGVPPR